MTKKNKQRQAKPERTPAQQRSLAEMLKNLAGREAHMPAKRVKHLRATRQISRKLTKELLGIKEN